MEARLVAAERRLERMSQVHDELTRPDTGTSSRPASFCEHMHVPVGLCPSSCLGMCAAWFGDVHMSPTLLYVKPLITTTLPLLCTRPPLPRLMSCWLAWVPWVQPCLPPWPLTLNSDTWRKICR
jgi:hypothetical protein